MNCTQIKPDLALVALGGALGESREQEVRRHCRICSACAAELREFETVTRAHQETAEEISRLDLQYQPQRLPRRVAPSYPMWPRLRLALPVAAVALMVLMLVWYRGDGVSNKGTPQTLAIQVESNAQSPQPPATMAAYQRALRNGDALDDLLARDERKLLQERLPSRILSLRSEL